MHDDYKSSIVKKLRKVSSISLNDSGSYYN